MKALRGRVGSVVVLAIAGCFGDPPTGNPTGSADDSGGGTTSVPTTDASSGTLESASGSGSGSVESGSSGGPCAPEDPECVEPGETIWEVVVGGAGHDAAYTMIVDEDGDVIVAGEYAGGGASEPWFVRLDADGNEQWSNPTTLGEGDGWIRKLALMGGGVVLGVGWHNGDAYLETRNAGGATVGSTTYDSGEDDFLISVLRRDDSLWSVGFVQIMGATEPAPLLLRHAIDGDGWQLDFSSFDTGVLAGVEGQLFDVAAAPNGNLVVVGAVRGGDGSYDASVQIFSPAGDLLSEPFTIGGAAHDDFYLVDVDDDGSGVAVGRSISETASEILMMHFTLEGDTVSSQWEHAWTDAPFTYANGFARDGDTVFIATGTTTDPSAGEAYDAMILRWDGRANEPTWTVPFAADAPHPHRDYASDVELAPDGTLLACGVFAPDATDQGNAWIRKLAR